MGVVKTLRSIFQMFVSIVKFVNLMTDLCKVMLRNAIKFLSLIFFVKQKSETSNLSANVFRQLNKPNCFGAGSPTLSINFDDPVQHFQ